MRIDGVFDIETTDWDTFVVGGFLRAGKSGATQYTEYTDPVSMANDLLAFDGHVYAHFGGGFDFKWLLDYAAKRGLNGKIIASGALIKAARIGKLYLKDSFALFPESLEKLTTGFGLSKGKLDLPCVCGEETAENPAGCGGYCSIKPKLQMRTDHWQKLTSYLKRDCYSLWEALHEIAKFTGRNGIDAQLTVGSTAWKHAQRFLDLPDCELSPDEYTRARAGYYGGRTQVFRIGDFMNVYEYDVNSMYPAALAETPLPWGAPETLYDTEAERAYRCGKTGIFDATVYVENCHVPPVPFREKDRNSYPVGTFRGSFTSIDLDRCAIVKIHSGIVWPTTRLIFGDWVRALFALRKQVGKDTPLGTFVKYILNSLTGKLGMKSERFEYEINPDEIVICTCEKDRADCKCNPHEQLSSFIYRRLKNEIPPCAHPEWAAYLTSASRAKLRELLIYAGGDALYCDTDSVFSLRPLDAHPLVDDGVLGKFSLKAVHENMTIYAPKLYETHTGDKHKYRAKGVKGIKKIEIGTEYRWDGIAGFGLGARAGELFQKREMKRTLAISGGDRIILPGGFTMPPKKG